MLVVMVVVVVVVVGDGGSSGSSGGGGGGGGGGMCVCVCVCGSRLLNSQSTVYGSSFGRIKPHSHTLVHRGLCFTGFEACLHSNLLTVGRWSRRITACFH